MPPNANRGRSVLPAIACACLLIVAGCRSEPPPVYQGKQGFRFTPPAGWAQRDRDDLLPPRPGQRPADVPLPPLETPEKMVVRYDRVTAGNLAWIRVSVTDLPAASSLKDAVSARTPQPDWQPEREVENLEVSGMPAARIAFKGRWHDQDYVSETIGVRQGEQVFFITASFPAADTAARDQARQAVERATWK